MRRVWLRAAALALGAIGVLVGLTLYFSSEKVPPCLVSGAPRWRSPTDNAAHRYEVVLLTKSACFFDMDDEHRLAGELPLARAGWLLRHVPSQHDTLVVVDRERRVTYVTDRGFLGFVVERLSGKDLYEVHFEGFTWNPRFGPNPPSHGLSLAPDRPELWVLDAPNSTVHVFDISGLPKERPRPLADIRLSKPLSGKENPCTSRPCGRIGSLQHSADGRFVYVGDSGDVIDTRRREEITNLDALHNSRVHLEVDFVDGRPVFPAGR
jgi:hypothetical protein